MSAALVLSPSAALAAASGSGTSVVDHISGITCSESTFAARDLPGSGTVCAARHPVTDADADADAQLVAMLTLPPTGVRVEYVMQAGGVLLAVGTTLLLIRRKRRDLR
ncbi:LPXTG cell wall anchor domain-containing protein [Actinospica robiniae]|uniref:LPXTG cell wall anchor domain-containing protein n=1 Tax=Actinospica robiniae TaxID=304901 RepID=UPI00041B49A1|nr:LPXTG cell wall anchor domain-containing protein [Actinospica robiniae]